MDTAKIIAGKLFFMWDFLKKNSHYFIITLLAVIFFVATSAFNYLSEQNGFVKFLAPDENANYVFSKLYATTGDLRLNEDNNLFVKDIIRPRSFRSDYGVLKPVSFLGISLIYGSIGRIFGVGVIPYLTPFFGALGIIFFYLLIKKIFDARLALVSAFLLTFFPPYLYYASRSMFHNVLFVVLLLMGLYFLILAIAKTSKEKKYGKVFWSKLFFAGLGGWLLGLAIITRSSELLWLLPMFFVLWLFYLRQISLTKLLLIIAFVFVGIMPALFWNQVLYDAPWRGGYAEMNQSLGSIAQIGSTLVSPEKGVINLKNDLSILKKLKDTIFYFGFSVRDSGKMFYYYFIRMFPWLFFGSILGLFGLFLSPGWRLHWKKYASYLVSASIFSVILIFYYGSWKFNDNPNPKLFTIGNSYTRYWLPIYLAAMPLAGLFFIKLADGFSWVLNWLRAKSLRADYQKNKFYAHVLVVVIISMIAFVSLKYLLVEPSEGLVVSYYRHQQAIGESERVLAQTEKDAVIITQYHDKLLFPERQVIVGLFDDNNMITEYAKLAQRVPVYYFNFNLPQRSVDFLNRKLALHGLSFKKVRRLTLDFTLYKLEIISHEAK